MCSSCQASQTGTQQRPLSFGRCPCQALGSPEIPGRQILVLCLQQFPSEHAAQGQGDSSGQEERGNFEPHGEGSAGTPRPAEEGKSPPMGRGPSWKGGNEIEREGMGLWGNGLKCNRCFGHLSGA